MPNHERVERAAFKKRLSVAERAVILTLAGLGILGSLYVARARYQLYNERQALLDKSAAEAAALSRREADILAIARDLVLESATADHGPLRETSALDPLLARPGLYVRMAQPDVAPRFYTEAVRSSPRDALVLCFLAPPETTSDYDVTVTATRALPGTPAFDAATREVQRLDTVQRGLRVLTPEWAADVKVAEPLAVRALEHEYGQRTPEEIQAAKTWAAAAYLLIVIDELPAGWQAHAPGTPLADSFRAPLLPAIHDPPHDVRVALYDIETRKPALRARIRLDVEAFRARTGLTESPAAQDCFLGAAARGAAAGK